MLAVNSKCSELKLQKKTYSAVQTSKHKTRMYGHCWSESSLICDYNTVKLFHLILSNYSCKMKHAAATQK